MIEGPSRKPKRDCNGEKKKQEGEKIKEEELSPRCGSIECSSMQKHPKTKY